MSYEVGGGAGGGTDISINVNTSSKAFFFAFDPSGNVWNELWVEKSGGHRLLMTVSGDSLNLHAFDLSGQTWRPIVVDVSGGNAIRVAGSFSANVSGNPVNVSGSFVFVSGQPVNVSGNVVSTSGGVVKISGETVRISDESGRATAQLKAYDFSGQTWVPLGVDVSGGSALKIAGSFAAEISGQTVVAEVSGQVVRISGSVVSVSGGVAKISGEVVNISGFPVNVSGNVVSVSGGAAKISGETVRLGGSGFSYTQIQAFDLSGGTFRDLAVDVSGGNALRIAGSFSANISGQVVSVSGGVVKISGETVVAEVSGQVVRISGSVVSVSGGVVKISGETVYLVSGQNTVELQAFDLSGAEWRNVIFDNSGTRRVLVSVSGQPVTVNGSVVNVSGNVVSVSGGVAKISGEVVQISGQVVSVSGGVAKISGEVVNISGNVVSVSGGVVKISGETVRLGGSGFSYTQIQAFDLSGGTFRDLAVDVSGGNALRIAGSFSASVSGQPVNVTSGQVQITSGILVALVSGQTVRLGGSGFQYTHIQAFDLSGGTWRDLAVDVSGGNSLRIAGSFSAEVSGQTVVAEVSGQVVRISGSVVSVSGGVAKISGEVVNISGNVVSTSGGAAKISGETVRLGGSGFSYTQIQAFDLSGGTFRDLAVDVSGGNALRIAGSFAADISGQVVSTSGGVVKISGETITFLSGIGVRISGEAITFLSGIGVRISGEAVTFLSGIGVRVSGESVRISTESGRALVQLQAYDFSGAVWTPLGVETSGSSALKIAGSFSANVSGNVVSVSGGAAKISGETVYLVSGQNTVENFAFDASGALWRPMLFDNSGGTQRLLVSISGQPITLISGAGVRISGEAITFLSGIGVRISGEAITFLSGIGVRISGEAITFLSGIGVRISGEVVSTSGGVAKISGESVVVTSGQVVALTSGQMARNQLFDASGAVWRDMWAQNSGGHRLQVAHDPLRIRTRTTLLITGASGGIALTSGDAFAVTIRNVGLSGTVMYVGCSAEPPWVASGQTYPAFSGFGLWMRDGDAVTLPCPSYNMNNVKIVSHTSGARVSYLSVQYEF